MKRLFLLAALMLAFATAPAFADGCASHTDTTETEEPASATGAQHTLNSSRKSG